MEAVEEYCMQLRRRQVGGAMPCARRTAEILRSVLSSTRHPDPISLIDEVRSMGLKMQQANPVELSIGNVVRRVLHLIREEARDETMNDPQQPERSDGGGAEASSNPGMSEDEVATAARIMNSAAAVSCRTISLSNLLDAGFDLGELLQQQPQQKQCQATQQHEQWDAASEADSWASTKQRKGKVSQWRRKAHVIEAINELIDELENIQQSITIQGVEHIHAKEVILTVGHSLTTLDFLREASKKRDFQVVVAEGAPCYGGHTMAKKLSSLGIQTTLIPDSAVFAMMARANKVLVGAHAVLANGGVIAPVGTSVVSLAARQHRVPLVVLVGLHKLSPLFPNDPELALNDFRAPSDVADLELHAEAFCCAHRGSSTSGVVMHAASPGGLGDKRKVPHGADNLAPSVHVPNPEYDYVQPHYISLFVTDLGGYTPSYEFYDRKDYLLSQELSGDRVA